jgi:DNA-binding NarL/FixJ family response regulator
MRIIVAEDSTLLREGLVSLLERFGHAVIATAADAPGLIRAVDAMVAAGDRPDVVLADVRMPPDETDDGIRAALAIRRTHPGLPIVMLSQYVADAYVRELLDDARGAIGYLLKDRIGRIPSFLRALESVVDGGVVIDPEVVRHITASGNGAQEGPLARLTERESTVLARMAEGEANSEIARSLHVSDAAIAKHVGNIFLKLGLAPEDSNRRVKAVLAYFGRGHAAS